MLKRSSKSNSVQRKWLTRGCEPSWTLISTWMREEGEKKWFHGSRIVSGESKFWFEVYLLAFQITIDHNYDPVETLSSIRFFPWFFWFSFFLNFRALLDWVVFPQFTFVFYSILTCVEFFSCIVLFLFCFSSDLPELILSFPLLSLSFLPQKRPCLRLANANTMKLPRQNAPQQKQTTTTTPQ
jgi:hypothetical protein